MIRRILLTSAAAATLLAAAPAFAAENGSSKQSCSCCSDGSIHEADHPLREAQKQQGSAERKAQRTNDDNPDVRNQSWGG